MSNTIQYDDMLGLWLHPYRISIHEITVDLSPEWDSVTKTDHM